MPRLAATLLNFTNHLDFGTYRCARPRPDVPLLIEPAMRGACGDLNTACSHTSLLELFRSSEDALYGMRELIEASRADQLVVDPQIQTILTRFNTH